MGISPEEILALFHERKMSRGLLINRMEEIQKFVNGDVVVPLPELDAREKSAIPNLIEQGLSQMAQRIASVSPDQEWPALRPGIDKSEELARQRRLAALGWWDMNRMDMVTRQRSRYLLGYGTTPIMVSPVAVDKGDKRDIPHWQVANPLHVFPSPPSHTGDIRPSDVIVSSVKPLWWLKKAYPAEAAVLAKGKGTPDTEFELLAYNDADESVLIVCGQAEERERNGYDRPAAGNGGAMVQLLERAPNRAGKCLWVMPYRIALDRVQGHFDSITGMYMRQAKLDALQTIAITRAIFPDEWLISHPQAPMKPRIIVNADGRKGIMGEVENGMIQVIDPQPPQATSLAISNLERSQRVTAGIPADFGGECVDEETEILTAEGWKHHDEVFCGTEVLTLNHETGMSEWQTVEKMNVFRPEAREMMLMEGQRFSSLTTMNHRWAVVSRWNGARKWKHSADLTSNDLIPTAVLNAGVPVEAKFSDALVELVAWFYTEGSYRDHKGVPTRGQISQSLKNADHLARIEAACIQLFGPATTRWRQLSGAGHGNVGHDGVPRWCRGSVADNGVVKIELSAHAVRMLLDHAPEKVPTNEFIRSLTQAQLELFLNVSMWADNAGWPRFGQKDVRRTEAFALACVLSGRGVSYQTRVRTDERPEWPDHTAHIIRIKKRRVANPMENAGLDRIKGAVAEKVIHDGMVWCPTTPNGTWFARRKGTTYFTGNSATNIRTARRGDQVMGATVDMPIMEYQEILAQSNEAELEIGVAIMKKCFGSRPTSFYLPRDGRVGRYPDYTPNEAFETDMVFVKYSMPGADANELVIALGQRVGFGEMSIQTAQEMDPAIEDPARERAQITAEALDKALLQGIQTQAEQPGYDPSVIARMRLALAKDPSQHLAEVYLPIYEDEQAKAQQAQQQAQQQQGPPGMPPTAPGGVGAPPGAGGPPAIGPAAPSQVDLSTILQTLRRPQNQGPAEKAAAGAVQQ